MNQLFEGGPQTVSLWKLIKMELYMDPDRQVEIQYIYIYLWVVWANLFSWPADHCTLIQAAESGSEMYVYLRLVWADLFKANHKLSLEAIEI